MTLATVRFWAAVILLLDAGIGLLLRDRAQPMVRSINITRLAILEIFVACVLIIIHYWVCQ